MGLSPMGRIIAVTCTMPLIKLFGDDQAAWVKVMSIWAAIAFLLLINCFVKCEETVHIAARSEEKIPVGRSLKALVTNQYFWAVLLLWMFQSTNQAVVGTILPYYCKYVLPQHHQLQLVPVHHHAARRRRSTAVRLCIRHDR